MRTSRLSCAQEICLLDSTQNHLPSRSALQKCALGFSVALVYHLTPLSSRPLTQERGYIQSAGAAVRQVDRCVSLVKLQAQQKGDASPVCFGVPYTGTTGSRPGRWPQGFLTATVG